MTSKAAAAQTHAALKKKEWTQADLARHLRMHKSVVSRILSGDRRATLDFAAGVEDLLGVPARLWV